MVGDGGWWKLVAVKGESASNAGKWLKNKEKAPKLVQNPNNRKRARERVCV